MGSNAPIKLLTFDLDDTLWECAPVLQRAEQITYAWLQQHCPRLTRQFTPVDLRERRFELARQQPQLAHRFSQLRLLSLQQALLDAGLSADDARASAEAALAVFLQARHEVQLIEEVERVLAQLSRHYVLGAITNGNVEIARIGLNRYFSLAINAEHLPRAKPHPEPFLAALQQAGCAAESCIHIGDDMEHDIRGAQRLGIHTIWVNRLQAPWPDAQRPNAEIRHLAELPDAVNRVVSSLGGAL
jgi:FMN hydrolase / 5-amino-6-(5-phospho-D-ribitylamino)uracil phosphatase